MGAEKYKHLEKNLDLRDEQNMTKILVSHDPKWMEKLRVAHNLTKERIELFSQYAVLRNSIKNKIEQVIEGRRKRGDKKTPIEEKLGFFIEAIEPQVQGAVIKLRNKGYKTYSSGFSFGAEQHIWFDENYFQNPQMFEKLRDELNKKGVKLLIKDNKIEIGFDKFYSLEKIKGFWDEIADFLPKIK